MHWTNIHLIFLREVRDQLRDRRTLFMVAVLPLLLYPALGIGMMQMTVSFEEQTRVVVLVGADELPEPKLIEGTQFVSKYFSYSEDAGKLRVITGQNLDQLDGVDASTANRLQAFVRKIEAEREDFHRLAVLRGILELPPSADGTSHPDAQQEEAQLRSRIDAGLRNSPAHVLIVFPRGFRSRFDDVNSHLRSRNELAPLPESDLHPVIVHNSANESSELAYKRVLSALGNWEDEILTRRLRQADLPVSLTNPIPMRAIDLAEAAEIAANVWSKIFPALLVIMSVTGAFYPAIDLGAGEKERGTMETLLISPATRTEIVLGKFLTVMLFSYTTALLNLTSMGFTGQQMLSAIGSAKSSPLGDLSLPPLVSLLWVVLLAIPLAALFSALSLALAMFARSSKEGQYYLTPLLMVTLGLTVFCLNPGVELTPYYSVLPVMGPALLLKSLLLGGAISGPVGMYAVPVLVTSTGYSLLALWWAIEQFQREDILFREAERFEVGLWIQHLLREKEATPSFVEAIVCFALLGLLQFLFYTSIQGTPGVVDGARSLVTVQLVFLIATVGVPPVLMALLLTTSVRQTLKLEFPSWKMAFAAVILPLSLQPLVLELLHHLNWFFPKLPAGAGAAKLMEAMSTDAVPLWLALATFAVAPAVCEELAFRGFILSGLQKSKRFWLPIVISSILFGAIHMIPKQVFNAALLGLVLGLLAVRSRSLIPGVIFHAVFNGTQVFAARLRAEDLQGDLAEWLFTVSTEGGQQVLRFDLPLLTISGLISAPILAWLVTSSDNTKTDELRPAENEFPI